MRLLGAPISPAVMVALWFALWSGRERIARHACCFARSPAALTLAQPHGGKLLWVATVWALGYSRYMATANRPPDTLAASLRHQHKYIDDLRASARMRARLMKKIPKSVDFPRGLVEVTNPGPSQKLALVGAATAPAMGTRIDPSALEEPPLPPNNASDVTYSTE